MEIPIRNAFISKEIKKDKQFCEIYFQRFKHFIITQRNEQQNDIKMNNSNDYSMSVGNKKIKNNNIIGIKNFSEILNDKNNFFNSFDNLKNKK